MGLGRWRVREALQGFLNVAWHGDGAVAVVIVPVQGHATVLGCLHVNRDGVPASEGGGEELHVREVGVEDKEVIYNQGEDDGVGIMLEEAWCDGCGPEVCRDQSGREVVEGYSAGLWEAE